MVLARPGLVFLGRGFAQTAALAQLFKFRFKAKAVPGGSVQRDCIRTAGKACTSAIARVGPTDTTLFILGTPYRTRAALPIRAREWRLLGSATPGWRKLARV
jgi:hypothetical protein